VLVAAALSVPATARAFCRTTTTPPPTGYDPSVSGCWTEGKPIAWTAGSVPYGLAMAASNQVSLAEATRVADLAFAAWNSAFCVGGAPSVQAYDIGPLDVRPDSSDCTSSSTCNAATHDAIVFRDVQWPYDDPVNTLALTTVTYGVSDGEIFEAYTEVNTAMHTISTEEPPPNGSFDLQAILTHEAGHFLGLAHATDTHSIMYAYYQAGAINLTPDDDGAICTVYAVTPASGSCQAGASSRSPSETGYGAYAGAFGLSFLVLSAWRRRRRAGASS
jgi:hypothetical protein